MAEDSNEKRLNEVDSSAADVLLGAVSLVREKSQVIVLLKHEDSDDFYIHANMNRKDLHWTLSQACSAIINETIGEGEDADASE